MDLSAWGAFQTAEQPCEGLARSGNGKELGMSGVNKGCATWAHMLGKQEQGKDPREAGRGRH